MDAESGAPDRNKIPDAIEDDSCNIVNTEWQRPGVWYAANESDDRSAGEFYIVERDSACISSAAKSSGKRIFALSVGRLLRKDRGIYSGFAIFSCSIGLPVLIPECSAARFGAWSKSA